MAKQKGIGDFNCDICQHQGKCEYERPRLIEGNYRAWELAHFSPSVWKDSINGLIGLDWAQVKAITTMPGVNIGMDASMMIKLGVIEQARLEALPKDKNG